MRSPCIVPACRRTHKIEGVEFICGNHWPLTDRPLRRLLTRARRQRRRQLCEYVWARLKRQAIERAAGC